MARAELRETYFAWMRELVAAPRRKRYTKLLRYLFDTEFYYSIPMDGNRAEDGISLRYHFGTENRVSSAEVSARLDIYPCSVLEMMVALAQRLEDDIMNDYELGDRTGVWFWQMIENLGLDFADDSGFDISRVEEIICRFLDRRYRYDGKGGLFYIPKPRKDLRSTEIWYQANWYLHDINEEGKV